MEATKKKSFWIVLIVIVAIIIVVQLVAPKQWTSDEANLVIVSDSDVPIAAIQVEFPLLDGSSASEGTNRADGSMIMRGDRVSFFEVRWPAIVKLYADIDSSQVLATLYIEEKPEDQCRWVATVYDSENGLSFLLESVPREQP